MLLQAKFKNLRQFNQLTKSIVKNNNNNKIAKDKSTKQKLKKYQK